MWFKKPKHRIFFNGTHYSIQEHDNDLSAYVHMEIFSEFPYDMNGPVAFFKQNRKELSIKHCSIKTLEEAKKLLEENIKWKNEMIAYEKAELKKRRFYYPPKYKESLK